MNHTIKIVLMLFFAALIGCEAEWRMGNAVEEHYGNEQHTTDALSGQTVDANGNLVCNREHSPYLESPSYCDQWPGLECCTWYDETCEIEWCRWHDACNWEWERSDCY
tara:strand:- start:1156 stop:1479 length:324 start_codon:yes stop_codon:yes gene_type:complete